MTEEWRDIPGWEGLYQASSEGRIRSLDRPEVINNRWGPMVRVKRGKVLRATKCRGYLSVMLSSRATRKRGPVSRFVCMAFHGPPPFPGAVTAHSDGVALNNRASNLRWATQRDNIADMVGHGTVRRGTDLHHLVKLSEDDVRAIRNAKVSAKEASEMFGVTASTIRTIRRRITWKHI